MANSFQNEQVSPELVTIAELAENLMYRLPGCADIMVRKTIQEVYREFCRETKCLTADRVFHLENGKTDYPVLPRFGGVVGEVREVWVEDLLLRRDRDYIVKDGGYPSVLLDRRFVRNLPPFVDPTGDAPIVAPSPWGVAEGHIHHERRHLRVVANEYPKINAEHAPSWFVQKYGDALTAGALSRLFSMQNRPWGDPQQAADERIRYENFKSETRMFKELLPGGQVIDTSNVL